ncbi:phospho-sugar mutase [Allofournierella massiliensis]|uniref:phospho-sugar mutase n=1 Tax=Allofournierella massiliensis TaxID=1650663 RepID=UPI00356A9F47
MYKNEYERWLAFDLDDPDLKPELESVKDDDEAIKDRFAVSLKFGTAGLRGVIGAGTNRMNVYVVRQATQGLANWVKTQGGTQTVAISYDSRIKSDVFAKAAAEVLAANGVKVRIYKALMPVPALSFATRYYNCNAGIMVTASHNPAKYNGYKAYGPDGCQMTDEAADVVYAEIQKTDVLSGARTMSFEDGMAAGLIEYVGEDCYEALYQAIESRSVRPGLCKTAGLKLVYSPLNGSGLVPVTRVLGDIGITDITIVPEQKDPDGNFPTCPYPNPEIFEALRLGLELAEKSGADLMLATDPDADRVGIAVRCKDGSYELLSGNEVGVLLLDYICKARIENGTMPKDPVMVKSIVSTPLADVVAAHYGVECRNVLTGFKWIGDQIARLEAAGQVERFIFGFEESYGYLAGSYVRDKDAVIGSMLICEMAAYYRSIGSSIKEELDRIYAEYGRYLNKVDSYEFPGLSGMDKMAGIMQKLRQEPPTEFAGYKVVTVSDYQARTRTELATGKTEAIDLPAANVLIYALEGGATVVVRPSGTEPKIKTYFTTLGKNVEEAQAQKDALAAALKPILA